MVGIDAHHVDTLSPSDATPHLTVNHDVAVALDSSNAFEGPEKLLEVWFAPTVTTLPATAKPNGLKAVDPDEWVSMLDMVNCKILSVLESENMDAYLLSESSMFVFPHKLILKTCGTTTLLLGLQRLLNIAAVHAGFPFHNAKDITDVVAAATPYRVFYSRKNFLFPDKQRGPHRSWAEEVKYLDDKFEGGSAYMVGKMNGDHWYLYITSPNRTLTPPRTPDREKVASTSSPSSRIPAFDASSLPPSPEDATDETLEILMTDLDTETAKQFYLSQASAVASDGPAASTPSASRPEGDEDVFCNDMDNNGDSDTAPATTEGHALGTVVSEACGLSSIYPHSTYPDARVDAYLFSPCGFSANGVVPDPVAHGISRGVNTAHYFTVHVTPEPNCSFASFETNVPSAQSGRTTAEIIEHVVAIFRPGRFSVTLFEAKGGGKALAADKPQTLASSARRLVEPVRGYRSVDRIVHDFEDYDLVFRYYERDDWVGGVGVRVGEVL